MARVAVAVADGAAFTVLVASGDGGGVAVELSVLVELLAAGVGAALLIAFFVAVELCAVGVAVPLDVSVRDGAAFGAAVPAGVADTLAAGFGFTLGGGGDAVVEACVPVGAGAGVAGGALGDAVDSCSGSHD